MAEKPKIAEGKKPDKTMAIVGLIINIVVLPGLGTIIGGRTKQGIIQLVLYIIGIPLIFAFGLGIILMIAIWIWALVSGIQLVKAAG